MLIAMMLVVMGLLVAGCAPKVKPVNSTGDTTTTNTAPGKPSPADGKVTTATNNTGVVNNECSGCHEMWPEIATWQTSVHARVACTVCHKGYDVSQNKAAHDSGSFAKPISVRTEVSDEACKGCHAMENRLATLLPDLKAPHEKYATAKVSCLECHKFTTHGNIADRKVATRAQFSDYKQWTTDTAKKAAPQVMRRPNMFVCIKCHEGRKVTTGCAACHYLPERASLPSHENTQWPVAHGKAGRQDVDNCAKCHRDKESQKFATPSMGDKIGDFARANSYCFGCHTKRPANHDGQWMSKHPQLAKDRGLLNCFACHDRMQPAKGANVTGVYCNNCHWFTTSTGVSAKK